MAFEPKTQAFTSSIAKVTIGTGENTFSPNGKLLRSQIVVMLWRAAGEPTATNTVISLDGVQSVMINGVDLGHGGYIDIGLIDTMNDLLVNFIGAVLFSIIGFFYIKHRGRGKAGRFARHFIPTIEEEFSNEQAPTDHE